MQELLAKTLPLVALAFLASAMFSVGLDLTVRQIAAPLRNRRLLGSALLAGVIVIPLIAFLLTRVIPMAPALAVGLMVYALAAGTEGGPKFVQLARGNAGFAVGLLAVLLSITVVFMPLLLSYVVPDAHIDRARLLVKLLMAVVVPIGAGLAIRATRVALADRLGGFMHRFALAFLAVFFVQVIVVNYQAMLALQPAAMLAAVLFFAIGFAASYLLGGPRWQDRRALAIMAPVRNAPISMTTASQVFPHEPGVLVMVTVLAALSVVVAVLAVLVLKRLPAPPEGAGQLQSEVS